jgi:hypothetical protein
LVSAAASDVREAIAIEVNAASRANATQDHRAGWKPAVTLAGVPRCPWAEKTALPIAMAKTVPSR